MKKNSTNLPKHIAIILDGNGRWAKKRMLPRVFGHREGMKRVVDIVRYCKLLHIPYLSLYAFSTENWKRPQEEVSALMDILVQYIDTQLNILIDHRVKIQVMGDISKLPVRAQKSIQYAIEKTKEYEEMILNIGINYGSRAEIVRAANMKLEASPVTEESFTNYLYTKDLPDVDLLIRPGGEKRLSNFMLYQMAYAELYFTDVLWPDFTNEQLDKAISEFQQRNRRFGGLQ